MDKKSVSERDIFTKYMTPALLQAGWDEMLSTREDRPLVNSAAHRDEARRQ
jgi:hypothetical protein